jgi:hypothetical protein
MKNIFRKILSLLLAAVLLAGVNSCVKDDFDTPPIQSIPVGDVLTVGDLWGMATVAPVKFTEDKSIYGVISMSEKNGNLYKQVFMQDATGGVALDLLSATGLAVGDSVRVYLKGARVFNYNDLLTIDSLDVTDNIVRIAAGHTVTPKEVSIADINTGSYVGQLIKVMDVQFKNGELGKTWADAEALATANRELEDCTNATIVRTSGYANFAGELLPEGNGSLVAIASSYRGTSQLYVRSMDEVDMNGERCGNGGGGSHVDPVDAVNEGFDSVEDYTDIALDGWTNIIVQGDRAWQGKTFNTEKYTQASGYNSGLAAMETWLITPPVTNISGKVLSFKSAKAYWTHTTNAPMTVYISTDYEGDNFETATWTELNVTMANESSSDNSWIQSGEVDLSAYSGNAAIAFKYVGSDAESTSYRLDDIRIDVSNGGGGGGGGTITPVDEISESFDAAVDYTDIDFDGWTNVNVQGDRKWQGKTFNTEKYTQASGYNSGLDAMETWLITPPVNNIGSKTLSLKSAKAYWAHTSGNPLTVLVSEDFVGDNFETATWTEIDVTLAAEGDADNAWIESGDVSLAAFSGTAAIAFKYVGSDTESTSFRLDDIVVTSNGGGGGGGGITPVDAIDEQFNDVVDFDDIAFDGWTNINVVGDRKWKGKIYNEDKYAQATGYNSNLDAMEVWLITPPINSIESKTLSLKTAKAYWAHSGQPFTVLVSEDFNGENFDTATWTALDDIVTAQEADADHAWIDSGAYSLSAFSGTAAIAFKYVGSNTESTTIRIDDILVQ